MSSDQKERFLHALKEGDEQGALSVLKEDAEGWVNHHKSEHAIELAVSQGMLEVIRVMLDAGLPVDAEPGLKNISMLLTASFVEHEGSYAIAAMLLERGADPNLRWSWQHLTPLSQVLDMEGLDTEEKDEALAFARLLLAHGADPGLARGDGFTPLMLAAGSGHIECMELLLDHGADPKATRPEHPEVTAWSVAEYGGHSAAMTMLEEIMGAEGSEAVHQKVKVLWARMLAAFEEAGAYGPAHEIRQAKGGGEAAIRQAQEVLGQTLPRELEAQWALMGDGVGSVWEYELLSVEHVVENIESKRELCARPGWQAQTPKELDPSARQVQAVWWAQGWVPVAQDGGGNLICVDLTPAPVGRRGQVILWELHAGPMGPIAWSWGEYLEEVVREVEQGRWRWDEDGTVFQD